ncbi:transcription activator acu-15 [Fusarium sp. NRRL 52700]|nr:transcription activator acu-15 [Fusarium sp. NRRL 52700]
MRLSTMLSLAFATLALGAPNELEKRRGPIVNEAFDFNGCVKQYGSVDFVDKSRRTPLSWAAGHGHANIVNLLLQKGANPNIKDYDLGRTPFLWFIKNEQIAVIEILKEKSPPELGYGLDPRPVPVTSPRLEEIQQRYKAALDCQDRIEADDITFLIEQGADVDVKKDNATSVLCQACWSGYGKVISLLIEKGVDPNGADKDGRTPLAPAAGAGHKEIVQNLLGHDVDIDPVDEDETTPMLMAACCRHSEIVLMLLEKGANPNAHEINGYNALSFVSESGDLGFIYRALVEACDKGEVEAVQLLLQYKPFDHMDKPDDQPMFFARMHNNNTICDGQIPKCQNCEKNGRECLVEDPATGLFRPRDYMQSLETRVAYLEGLLQQARPDVALDHLMGLEKDSSSFSPSAATPFVGPTESEPVGNGQRDVSAEAEDARDQLSTDVALLCLTTASKEPHYFGPSSAVSFSRIISTAIDLPKRSQASTIRFEHGGFLDWNCPQPFPISFPSPPLGTALSQAYFGNIHAQYPFLHEPTFRFWEEQCFKADLSGNLSAAGDMAQFFVWMVYATASLALGPAHYDTAESYYKMALKHQPAILELDSIESIQSLLSQRGGLTVPRKSSGLAIRYCIQLGYHRSASRFRRNANPLIAEMSKRCFWVAYDIDRVASFILGRPVGIPDDCIDAELPLDIDDDKINALGLLQNPRVSSDEPPTNMTGAIHVIKLRRLWSKIGNTIYPSITQSPVNQEVTKKPLMDQLRAELEAWHSEIPYAPDTTGLDPLHWITHKALPGEEDSVEEALECCMKKAKELCLLYRRLFQYQSLQFTWGSLHILFLGGLTYLYCIWKSSGVRQSTKRMDIINTCMACNTALVIIAERWSKAVPYRDIFEVLSERTISLVCGDGSLSRGANEASQALDQNQSADPRAVEDWALDIVADDMPVDSEWFVQELLQGMSNNEA